MKKILLVMSVAILMALCSAPSTVNAAQGRTIVGTCIVNYGGTLYLTDLWDNNYSSDPLELYTSGGWIYSRQGSYLEWYLPEVGFFYAATTQNVVMGYISTLSSNFHYTYNNEDRYIYGSYEDWYNALPDEFRPEVPSIAEERWQEFYDWFYEKFGYYPREGSLIDLIRLLAVGDWTDREEVEITYPTITTPTPTPTPIPVQTIFVPDGNGNTTIIYQYTDPTTGVITQSPYNPNIDIDVNCNCNSDNGNNTFGVQPNDPTALTSSMLWVDGFGVQITDNPLTAANDSQKSLAEAAAEYSDSVNVVSNSFNVLPFKWLVFVGLLGGILIIAGLIRTFLGG